MNKKKKAFSEVSIWSIAIAAVLGMYAVAICLWLGMSAFLAWLVGLGFHTPFLPTFVVCSVVLFLLQAISARK